MMWIVLGSLVILTAIFFYNFWIAIDDLLDFTVEVEAEEISKELWNSHKILRRLNK
jgi:hypothetical protein|tara:strand:- start:242 stop:409 length:168 start_codon:yes stop_codon:yes gene_type:complete